MARNFDEFPSLTIDHSFEYPSFFWSNDWSFACHTLDGRHPEILIDRDIDTRSRSSNESEEEIIMWRFDRKELSEDDVKTVEKGIDDDVDPFRWREPGPREEIFSCRKGNIFWKSCFSWGKEICICRRIDDFWIKTCIVMESLFYIFRIRINRIEFRKIFLIYRGKKAKCSCKYRSRIPREFREISFSQIIEVSRWSVTIIEFFCFFPHMPLGSETVSGKNNDIVFFQYSRLHKKSPLEHHMANPFGKYGLTERDHLALESELAGVKTPFAKKSCYKISIECFCHKWDESFPSSTIEKSIMDDGDFWFFHWSKGYWK